jgi:hypothetical protein
MLFLVKEYDNVRTARGNFAWQVGRRACIEAQIAKAVKSTSRSVIST